MMKIALLGECMVELNGVPFGEMQQAFGGDSLNTAVYLRRLLQDRASVEYVSVLGCDPLSDGIRLAWQEEGIGTDWVLTDPHRQPGLYLIQVDEVGERTFLYWRNQSAARYLVQHPQFEALMSHLATVDMVYLSGISLAILPAEDRWTLLDSLSELAAQGIQIVFDSNYRPALWENAEIARACYRQILSMTHIALVTNDDERALWGDDSENATLRRLQRLGVKHAVVKMGAQGNLYQDFSTQNIEHIATLPIERVVDTTSAGDSFNAGFLAGWCLNESATRCSQWGHQLAGVVIQHKGAILPKSLTETLTFPLSTEKEIPA